MIRPEFWEDDKIGECSPTARLLFVATWNFADDEGYLEYRPRWLKAKCFPYDELKIEPLIDELLHIGCLEIRGDILWIKNFLKHQKIEKPKPSELSQKFKDSPTPPRKVVDPSPTKEKRKEEKLSEVEVKEKEVKTSSYEEGAELQKIEDIEKSSLPENSPPPKVPRAPPPEYGNREINETLKILTDLIGIDDFTTPGKWKRIYAKNCLNLTKQLNEKYGSGEFIRRLKILLDDKYKRSQMNDIKNVYEQVKGFIEPIKESKTAFIS